MNKLILVMCLVVLQADAFVRNISQIAPRFAAAARTTILNSRNLVKHNMQESKSSMISFASKGEYLFVTRPSLKNVGKVPSPDIQNGVAYPFEEMKLKVLERWYQKNSSAIRQKIDTIKTLKNEIVARIIESDKVQFLKYSLSRPSLKRSGKLTSTKIEEGVPYSFDEIRYISLEERYQKGLNALKGGASLTGFVSAFMYGICMSPVEDFDRELDIF